MALVLLATGLVVLTCCALAGLLLVAERYLQDFGTCAVNINDGQRTLETKGGQSVLAALMRQGIFIPSACGGRGTCAYCRLKVTAGGGPPAPAETALLTPQELAQGLRLSCQVKIRTDVSVVIPEELFLIREYVGRVERMEDLTHDIKRVLIALIEPETIEFKAGQYVQLEAPAYGRNPEPVYRAYSMANPPSDNRHVELIIRLVPDGICTTWVFSMLREGDEVRLNGPYGKFGLSDTDAEMVWIAGGSGMAPFWSLVRHMREKNIARKTMYFFGAVRKRDLFFVEELARIARESPWFAFIPALSAPAPEERWEGETGLITEVVDRHVDRGEGKEAYLCGSPGMIDAAIKVLKKKGIGDERIFFDKFA